MKKVLFLGLVCLFFCIGIAWAASTQRSSGGSNIERGGTALPELTVDGNTYLATTSGNVGIGTTSPNNLLSVFDLIDFNNTDLNTKLGYQAGKNIVAGATNNTFLGYWAGLSSATLSTNAADYNTGLGAYSLNKNTTGYRNSAVGYTSLYNNTTGYRNSAVGSMTLYSNTTGYQNSAIGAQSLYSNTAGYDNIALGFQSQYNNTSGYYNISLGNVALLNNTVGYLNNSIGYQSLYTNTTGYYNFAGGVNSLYSNTTGYHNTALGTGSLYALRPTSKAITAFADYSGTVAGTVLATSVGHGLTGVSTKMISGTTDYNGSESITVVDADTFYFTATWTTTQTGWWAIDSEGRYNVAIGYQSGRTLITGDSNTFLGYNAGFNASQLTSASNSMALGNGAYTTASNQVVIGNTSITQTLLNGNIGIGTIAPASKLELVGIGTTSSTSSLSIKDSLYASKVTVLDNGNVGIGTTNPIHRLDVVASTGVGIGTTLAQDVIAMTTNGNVGIGSAVPATKLAVVGRISQTTWTADGDVAVFYDTGGTNALGVTTSDKRLKKDLMPFIPSADVLSVPTYLYHDNDQASNEKKKIGMLAQDMLKVCPETVFTYKKDDEVFYGIHYERLSVILWNIVKEQDKRITELEKQVKKLEGLK